MKLPLYEVQPEDHVGGAKGFRICLNFRGELLPLPDHWFRSEEVARMRVARMQREDFDIWQQENRRNGDL